jgi:hypothetical protein
MLYGEIFNIHTAQDFTIIEGGGQPKKIKTQQVIIKKKKSYLNSKSIKEK